MNDTESSLIAAIVANPDDDMVRLVYADFLDEQEGLAPHLGEAARARAAFIRLEIEMARMMPDKNTAPDSWEAPGFRELEAQTRSLYNHYNQDWFGDLDRLTHELGTHRGFVDHIALSARKFIAHGEEIYRLAPTIHNVFISRLGRNMPALASCPALQHVRELVFFETPVRAREAEDLAESPYLRDLQKLDMPFTDTQIGPRGARALARPGLFTVLEHLDIGNHAVYDEGAAVLLRARQFATLRFLGLANNGLTDYAAEALAEADHLSRLARLDLMHNHLTAYGVSELARAPHLAGLEFLSLYGNNLGDAGAEALAAAGFARLTDLKLSNCSIADRGCAALFASPTLAGLKMLHLSWNRPGAATLRALADGRRPLEVLGVAECEFGPVEAAALTRIESLPRLRRLDMDGNPLGSDGVHRLLDGILIRPLAHLSLEKCQLGDDGAEAIANCPGFTNLRVLHLGDNQITDRGALALARSVHLAGVWHLWLRDNHLGEETKAVVRERFGEHGCWV